MTDIVAQASFNSGEWAPNLFARVDLQKYRSGAALLENFYIDYRGGASTRPGTKYILQARWAPGPTTPVRLITFQASTEVGYALEFGELYIRFYFRGSPILEDPFAVTAASQADPCVVTAPGHNYAFGDWVWVDGIAGMSQLNGRYFVVAGVSGDDIALASLVDVPIDSTGYTAYVSGGTTQRVYTIASPYTGAELAQVKFAQSQNEMILCHPNHPPQLLTLVTTLNWTLTQITFGSTAAIPTGLVVTSTLGAGTTNYSYVATSIDSNGQESAPSAPASLLDKEDIRATAGSNKIKFPAVATAAAYNFYESSVSYFGVVPSGVSYGFIGTSKSPIFIDSNIGQNFSESPPIPQNPFVGDGVAFVSVTAPGAYTSVPLVSFTGGTPSIPASAIASLGALPTPTISAAGAGFVVGDTVTFLDGVVMVVSGVAAGAITSWDLASDGSITSGSTPANPIPQIATSGAGTGAAADITWGVTEVVVLVGGAGYDPPPAAAPTVVFSAGAATAVAVLAATSNGNPTVPSFYQQRLILAAPVGAPQTFYMSQPGSYFNYDISDPVQSDDAISATLVDGVVNNIKSIISYTTGMLILTDRATWLVNGGSNGSAVTPTTITSNRQSSVGASDVPPIVANFDILLVQSKGSAVRDLAFNIYFNVFTGTDISITSSHLFFNHQILEWAWAESPFYVVWAVRDDGVMLTLTFLKEQEFVGWTHQTTAGLFKSVCTVSEVVDVVGGTQVIVDGVYTVVQRVVEGDTVQYIERVTDRIYKTGLNAAWCVDAGLQYLGAPILTFSGAEHLAGLVVTGIAEDDTGEISIIRQFFMPASGEFTLPTPDSPATGYITVTLGLGYTCSLQTLAIDVSKDQIQGKLKKIPYVDVRVNDTLGLDIGSSFATLTPMKDLVMGNVSSMLTGQGTQLVTGLYSGDARTTLDPTYTIPGQYCIRQSKPYPATVLGVFPTLVVGDD